MPPPVVPLVASVAPVVGEVVGLLVPVAEALPLSVTPDVAVPVPWVAVPGSVVTGAVVPIVAVPLALSVVEVSLPQARCSAGTSAQVSRGVVRMPAPYHFRGDPADPVQGFLPDLDVG